MKTEKKETDREILQLTINGKKYDWNQESITGAKIREQGNIPLEDEILIAIKKPWDDEQVTDEKQVNLTRHEIEEFYSKEKHFNVTLMVNGRPNQWNEKRITFEKIIILAFGSYDPNPNKVYTVTYDRGPRQNPEGSMVKGDKVFVTDKMIFNATGTDKS